MISGRVIRILRLRLEISLLLPIFLSLLLGTVCASCIALAPQSTRVSVEDVLMESVDHARAPVIVIVIVIVID
jgi:hypothetical protein